MTNYHFNRSDSLSRSRKERADNGRALRDLAPRTSHARWEPFPNRRDPIDILEESNQGRLPELIPIRYGRMLPNPFTFLRGSAAVMAYDLATTPKTDIWVQACGDCHVLNFGLFATPERNLVFDINDFDESLPGPWEWDIKRLCTSLIVAGRENKHSDKASELAVLECVRSYRERLREYSRLSPLDIWYTRIDAKTLIAMAPDADSREARQKITQKARKQVIYHLFPKIVDQIGGQHRFVDQPPVLVHITQPDLQQRVEAGIEEYRESLSDERKILLDRYRIQDFAMKVVGIGSVGTRCYITLLFCEDDYPLILQVKEARRSVLEPYTAPSCYDNQGERVVMGQRLMQSSSDIFLGWVRSDLGYDFYVRQLRDMKISFPLEGISSLDLRRYAEVCGWTLARAHAKSGDAAMISGYLGKGDVFDTAIAKFALAYADQTERDHEALKKAVKTGRIKVSSEED